jgi:hypothetical protein
MEKEKDVREKRGMPRAAGDAVPEKFREAVISIDGGGDFRVIVVNMSGCGFLFQTRDESLPSILALQEGREITARFPGTDTIINGICVRRSSGKDSVSLGVFISDPYAQEQIREVFKRG